MASNLEKKVRIEDSKLPKWVISLLYMQCYSAIILLLQILCHKTIVLLKYVVVYVIKWVLRYLSKCFKMAHLVSRFKLSRKLRVHTNFRPLNTFIYFTKICGSDLECSSSPQKCK